MALPILASGPHAGRRVAPEVAAAGLLTPSRIAEDGDEHAATICPRVTVNDPFRGGYITRSHAAEMPWVQLELSRGPFAANSEKRRRVLRALAAALQSIAARA